MIEDFKKTLSENGQSIRWFYKYYNIKDKCSVTYGGFCHQLNGYAPLSEEGKKAINKYLGVRLDTDGQILY